VDGHASGAPTEVVALVIEFGLLSLLVLPIMPQNIPSTGTPQSGEF
jgi:hypothetical protein